MTSAGTNGWVFSPGEAVVTWHRRSEEPEPPLVSDGHRRVTVSCVAAPVQTYIPVQAR